MDSKVHECRTTLSKAEFWQFIYTINYWLENNVLTMPNSNIFINYTSSNYTVNKFWLVHSHTNT